MTRCAAAIVTMMMGAAAGACAPRSGPAAAPLPAPVPPAGTVTLSLAATSDLHGHLEALPWLSAHLRALRAARSADGGDVLLVDAGDMFQGTLESNLSEGGAVVAVYNALGYAAAALGNHEFDYGPEGASPIPTSSAENPRGAIEARAREAKFPLLSANIRHRDGAPWSPPNIRPSVIIERAGIRIGLVGVTTADTPEATDPRNLVGLDIIPLAGAIATEARALRQAGATLVVALAHAGASCKSFAPPDDISSCAPSQEIFDVARALPPGLVDAIASGHTHAGVAHRVNGIAIVGPYAHGVAFGRIDFTVDRRTGQVTDTTILPPRFVCREGVSRLPRNREAPLGADVCQPGPYEGQAIAADTRLDALIAPHRARAAALRHKPLGLELAQPFTLSGRRESPAANLLVDAMLAARPRADVAFHNGGGLRAPLPAGPLTYGSIYELVPFDNAMASIELKAGDFGTAVLRSLTAGTLPAISGLRGRVQCQAEGPAIAWERLDGTPVAAGTPLLVATSGFLTANGDGFLTGLPGARSLEPVMLRDVVAEALSARGGVLSPDDPATFDPSSPRLVFPGALPLQCPAPLPHVTR